MLQTKISLWMLWVICCLNIAKCEENINMEKDERKGRIFSLFNIVRFKQETCEASSDTFISGTCMTGAECASAGGSGGGHCASGFGVCCIFISKCESGTTAMIVSRNSQYPSSLPVPAAAGSVTKCTYTFSRIVDRMCQISGVPTDYLTVTSPTSTKSGQTLSTPPVLCGTLTKQHMYIETGTTGNAGIAEFTFTSAGTRTFNIKVTYYTCDSLNKAPSGCVQYFTAVSGSFQSYNFNGAAGTMLASQNYQTCIRQALGYCSVSYRAADDAFKLVGILAATVGVVSIVPNSIAAMDVCTANYVMIPSSASTSTTNRYCGAYLNPEDAQKVSGAVVGNVSPFVVRTYSGSQIGATAVMTPIPGYSIDYSQVPCNSY